MLYKIVVLVPKPHNRYLKHGQNIQGHLCYFMLIYFYASYCYINWQKVEKYICVGQEIGKYIKNSKNTRKIMETIIVK